MRFHRIWSEGNKCSLSCLAALGTNSLSAKSRQLFCSIWCVSGNEDKLAIPRVETKDPENILNKIYKQ